MHMSIQLHSMVLSKCESSLQYTEQTLTTRNGKDHAAEFPQYLVPFLH